MVDTEYCKFHRVVRDCKLSILHVAGGIFLKAQMFSNNLWAVNKRPFNIGKFGEDKKRLLNIFLSMESCDGPLFQKYGHKIAEDYNMPFESDDDRRAVWDCVASLPTFRQAGEASAENVTLQRETERERETQRETEIERERESER